MPPSSGENTSGELTHTIVDSKRAWIAAAAVALANGMAFGTIYTFGIFFDAMADELQTGRGATAVIFGITLLAFFGFGIVSGPISDRIGPRPVLVIGSAFFVGGLLATSLVESVTLGYLTYGLGVGLGGGWFVAPLTGLIGSLFLRWRTAALGLAAVGNGLGTLLLVPLSERWVDAWGWRDAYQALALLAAVVLVVAWLGLSDRPGRGAESAPPPPVALSTDPRFWSMWFTSMLMSVGLFAAFGFIVPFATDNGVATSTAARLMAVVGLASILGRLGLTGLADRLGAVRLFQLVLWIQPFVYLIWLSAGASVLILVTFTALLGVTYGGFVAISPEIMFHFWGPNGAGRAMGYLFTAFGVGGLIGPPLAGLLAEQVEGQSVVIGLVIAIVAIASVVSLGLTRDAKAQAAVPAGAE